MCLTAHPPPPHDRATPSSSHKAPDTANQFQWTGRSHELALALDGGPVPCGKLLLPLPEVMRPGQQVELVLPARARLLVLRPAAGSEAVRGRGQGEGGDRAREAEIQLGLPCLAILHRLRQLALPQDLPRVSFEPRPSCRLAGMGWWVMVSPARAPCACTRPRG